MNSVEAHIQPTLVLSFYCLFMVLKQNPGCHKFKDYGNRCDNMADDTIHVLLSTGNREGHRMMRVVVGTM